MQIRNFLPSYRVSIVIVAAIAVIVAVVILFPTGEKRRETIKPAVKESVKDAGGIFPKTITEETKRSLSERPPGAQVTIISEETKRSLSERSPGSVPTTITPEVAQSLSTRSNN